MGKLNYNGPIVLVVMDGVGLSDETEHNAGKQAHLETLNTLMEKYPCAKLGAAGKDVGVPDGDMGNSEVGHNAMGAGEIVLQRSAAVEDAVNKGRKEVRILNLFAYTGAATLACAAHGATEVVHVDASKGMIARAKENVSASGLNDSYIRFIADDCKKFVEREIRRGRKYEGIIMDPPSYGRGPSGELWKLEDSFYDLVSLTSELLSDDPLFFIASSYATEITAQASGQILSLGIKGGKVVAGEIGLPVTKMGINLPCGSVARWTLN